MKLTRDDIYTICIKRLAQIFGLDISQIDLDMNWDCKLFNVKRSFWEVSPFEELSDDIEDAANELTLRKIMNRRRIPSQQNPWSAKRIFTYIRI